MLNEKVDPASEQKLQDLLRRRLVVHVLQQNKSKKSACKIKYEDVFWVKPEQVPDIVKRYM